MQAGSDQISVLLELGIGLIIIPWCVWVTASIFGQRTQIALLKAEVASVKKIEDAVQRMVEALHNR